MFSPESPAARAAKLSFIPGVTIADACDRFEVSRKAVLEARKHVVRPTFTELVLAALTADGTVTEGSIDDFVHVAKWVDYINHDGCTADQARALLAKRPELVIDDTSWKLVVAWP